MLFHAKKESIDALVFEPISNGLDVDVANSVLIVNFFEEQTATFSYCLLFAYEARS